MPGKVENPELKKPANEKAADAEEQKRIEHIAEKAAEKASHAEQVYDQNHQIFSK